MLDKISLDLIFLIFNFCGFTICHIAKLRILSKEWKKFIDGFNDSNLIYFTKHKFLSNWNRVKCYYYQINFLDEDLYRKVDFTINSIFGKIYGINYFPETDCICISTENKHYVGRIKKNESTKSMEWELIQTHNNMVLLNGETNSTLFVRATYDRLCPKTGNLLGSITLNPMDYHTIDNWNFFVTQTKMYWLLDKQFNGETMELLESQSMNIESRIFECIKTEDSVFVYVANEDGEHWDLIAFEHDGKIRDVVFKSRAFLSLHNFGTFVYVSEQIISNHICELYIRDPITKSETKILTYSCFFESNYFAYKNVFYIKISNKYNNNDDVYYKIKLEDFKNGKEVVPITDDEYLQAEYFLSEGAPLVTPYGIMEAANEGKSESKVTISSFDIESYKKGIKTSERKLHYFDFLQKFYKPKKETNQ